METFGSLIDLYTTLFVVAITALGALMAAIIALTQLLESFLVSKSARKVVYSWILGVSFSLVGIASGLALAPMVLLSMNGHDFVPWFDLRVDQIFTGHWYVILTVIFILAATVSVVVFIYRASQYLIPVNAIAFIRNNQKIEAVTDFFQKKSAVKPMHPIRFSILVDDQEDDESDEDKEKQYQRDLKKYENDKAKVEKMENPLFPLEAYLVRSIKGGNVSVARKTLEAFEDCIRNSLANKSFKGTQALIYYYKTVLENTDELSRSIGLRSMSQEVLESSSRVADLLIESKNYSQINILLEYWQSITSGVNSDDTPLFKQAVGIIGSTGRALLNKKKTTWKDIEDVIDNISRALGWIGERLLENPPEKRVLMRNDSYSTGFDEVMNAVLEIGWGIRGEHPDVYPLIHFDSLYVIAKKLARYVTNDTYNSDNGNSLFSLMYDVVSCGESAIIANNVDAACLALLRLEEHFRIADEHGLTEHKQNILNDILRLGALAASKEMKGLAHFMTSRDASSLSEAAIVSLAKHAHGFDLSHEAHEIIIKQVTGSGNYDKVRQYLSNAGRALGTDFGMNLSDS